MSKISTIYLNSQDKLLLLCAKIQPTNAELAAINSLLLQLTDWNLFAQRIVEKGYAPLLYSKLPLLPNANKIPPIVIKKLKDAYYKTTTRSMLLQQAFADCAQIFKANNIDVIALKGIYLSEYLYQNPALRLMSDIDLLVKVEDGPRAIALLHEMGYEFPTWDMEENAISMHDMDLNSGPIHYRQLIKNNISIEIHIKLLETEKYILMSDYIWSNAKKVTIYNQNVYTLEIYDLFIYLCLHLKRHFLSMEHVQFSSFADITNILGEIHESKVEGQKTKEKSKEINFRPQTLHNNESLMGLEDFEWDELERRAVEYKCTEIVYGFIALVNKYFDAPVPQDRIDNYRKFLNIYDEVLFIGYLQNDTSNYLKNKSNIRIHLWNMLHLSNKSAVGYLVRTIFPSKEFMVEKYLAPQPPKGGVKSQSQYEGERQRIISSSHHHIITLKYWWLWYPYRWAIGVKELVKLVIKKSK